MRKIYLLASIIAVCSFCFFASVTMVEAAEPQSAKGEVTQKVVVEPAVDAWDLGNGSRGDLVVQLQRMLAVSGCYAGAIDGVFGRQTEAAVQKAQLSMDMPVTGRSDRSFAEGLRRMNESSPSRGATFRATRVLTMEATAYTPYDAGVSGITANGNRMRRGLVAVDTRIIPFGTRLYIEGYGFAIADDTGGAIRGNKIDLAMDTLTEAYQFGRRSVVVHILE